MVVVDTKKWIIGKLSEAIMKYNSHFEFEYYALHPRDVTTKIDEFKQAVEKFKPDVIHFQYYRSCSQALELWPELKNYKIVLTHHNQRTKAVFEKKWQELGVNQLVCHTQHCRKMLVENGENAKDVKIIQHGLNLDYFEYSDREPEHPRIGYVGRIVPWKGLLEICKVARELNMKVLLMGVIDKPEYWKKVEEYKDVLDLNYYDCKDSERIDAYRHMTVYVGNSVDGFEEGPMGLLEAWASGVPVITTNTGEAKDLAVDGENAAIIPFTEYVDLELAIEILMGEDLDYTNGHTKIKNKNRQKLRKNGWNTVKGMTEQKMAREYSEVYHKCGGNKHALVSVVIPATYGGREEVSKILKGLENQTYKNIEVIVIWDEDGSSCISVDPDDLVENGYKEIENYNFPIKELRTNRYGYNLAMARNMGIVEAEGDYIMFNDARLCPEPDAIENFLKGFDINTGITLWLFGDKGGGKRAFVENFSFVERQEVVRFGMFNERIDRYGGMSQEIRTRWKMQGNAFHFVEEAKANELKSSKQTPERKKDIIASKLKLFKIFKDINF